MPLLVHTQPCFSQGSLALLGLSESFPLLQAFGRWIPFRTGTVQVGAVSLDRQLDSGFRKTGVSTAASWNYKAQTRGHARGSWLRVNNQRCYFPHIDLLYHLVSLYPTP